MTTIATTLQNMTAARVALDIVDQCVAMEQIMEDRLTANPTCPMALHDYNVSASATEAAVKEVERLGGNWCRI